MGTDGSALPRRDRWVVIAVMLALAALIVGFAASAPAFSSRARIFEMSAAGVAAESDDGATRGEDPVDGGSDGNRQAY